MTLLLGTTARGDALPARVLLVPVVSDPADAPKLLELAKVLREGMARRGVPTVAARYTATLDAAKATGDSFAAALNFHGELATLRYDFYSDELVRSHALRLLELAKAPVAIILAAPVANRMILKRISRDDGQSIALPDPCAPEAVQRALAELLPPDPSPETPAFRTHVPPRFSPTRLWLSAGTAALGAVGAAAAIGLAAKRRALGTQFQGTAPADEHYLALGDSWRARRAPMLASAAIGAASLTATGVLFATAYDQRKLRWVSIPAAVVGSAVLAWAASDIAHGATCQPDAGASCVHAQSQLDRGIMLTMLSAPPLAIAATHLGRWVHEAIQLRIDASPRLASLSLGYQY